MTRGPGRRLARVTVIVLTALALGAAVGWGAGVMSRPDAVPVSSRPLDASQPSAPETLLANADVPPLSTDVGYVDDRVYSAGTTFRLQRPEGWRRKVVDRGIRWVLPDDPDGSYSVRVAPTTGANSTAQEASSRLRTLRTSAGPQAVIDVEPLTLTDDTMIVTYVQAGRLKYQHTQFVAAGSGSDTSVFEISAAGRIEDRVGLDAMAEHMAASVSRG